MWRVPSPRCPGKTVLSSVDLESHFASLQRTVDIFLSVREGPGSASSLHSKESLSNAGNTRRAISLVFSWGGLSTWQEGGHAEAWTDERGEQIEWELRGVEIIFLWETRQRLYADNVIWGGPSIRRKWRKRVLPQINLWDWILEAVFKVQCCPVSKAMLKMPERALWHTYHGLWQLPPQTQETGATLRSVLWRFIFFLNWILNHLRPVWSEISKEV